MFSAAIQPLGRRQAQDTDQHYRRICDDLHTIASFTSKLALDCQDCIPQGRNPSQVELLKRMGTSVELCSKCADEALRHLKDANSTAVLLREQLDTTR